MSGEAMSIALASEAATAELAGRLAATARAGDLVALSGELGAGKTAFARAFIRALTAPDEEVPSPTFTLVQTYATPSALIWHVDLYRIAGAAELDELGLDEAFATAIVLLEWPERALAALPARRLEIRLEAGPTETARLAHLTGRGGQDWLARAGLVGPT